MRLTLFGHLIWFQRARADEPYWWHSDRSGNRVRLFLAAEQVTARVDGLTMWALTAGPWRVSIGRFK